MDNATTTTLRNSEVWALGLNPAGGGTWIADKCLGVHRGSWVEAGGAFGRFVGATSDYLGNVVGVTVAWSEGVDSDGNRRAPGFAECCADFDALTA